jgi:oligoendopeptidase F
VRREAVEKFLATLRAQQDVFAATLAGQVRLSVGLARARGYTTALEAYLDRDAIDPAVYRTLIAAVRANLGPLHRYIALRKRVLGVSQLRLYDLYTPLVPSVDMTFPYAEALRILPVALAPLGPDYVKVLSEGLDVKNGWLDLYPNRDKESGAFSSSVFGVHPFVKLNYYESADDLSTMAHELGHALHSYLAMKSQPVVTSGYPPFVAEIASTFNEKLLSDYLIAHARSDDERLVLLAELLETIRTTIYRQTLFSEFELALHTAVENGEPLTAETMNRVYGDLVRAYYGPDLTVGKNDEVEWAYIPHFFYKYYVFSYADGLAAGIALAEKVAAGDTAARDGYLRMLSSGNSRPPLELVRLAGVDLTQPDAVAAAARLMERTMDEMEKILAARGR